jgi:hypothetical protein
LEKQREDLRAVDLGIVPSVIFGSVPLLVFFFAVAMGINHRKTQNYHAANRQNDYDRLILPYLADKCGYV